MDRRTPNAERKHRLNREIMAPQVRLNGVDNEPLGIVSIQEALQMAGDKDVDLVEIAATADPPVCRLMDYGKFKYQEQKKAAEAKAKQKIIEIKEVKFRPGTDEGDYNIKMRNLRRFIAEDGDKGKVTLRYRGREITHQDIGMRLLERIRDELADVSVVEHMPKLEGRQNSSLFCRSLNCHRTLHDPWFNPRRSVLTFTIHVDSTCHGKNAIITNIPSGHNFYFVRHYSNVSIIASE